MHRTSHGRDNEFPGIVQKCPNIELSVIKNNGLIKRDLTLQFILKSKRIEKFFFSISVISSFLNGCNKKKRQKTATNTV